MTRRWTTIALLAGWLAACGGGASGNGAAEVGGGAPPGGDGSGPAEQQLAVCSDGIQNGAETAADCGGADCPSCAARLACLEDRDCASGVCTGSVCQAASCADGVRNGSETDVDCGGGCGSCAAGKQCLADGDCASGSCSAEICDAPAGAPIDDGTTTIGNLVETIAIVKESPSDPDPETLVYAYTRLQLNADVVTKLKQAGVTANASEALDQALMLGMSVPSLAILDNSAASPPALVYFTWRGESYYRYPAGVNGYDPQGSVETLLGIADPAGSDTLTLIEYDTFPLTAPGYSGTARVTRYDGAVTLVATVAALAGPPSQVTAVGDVGGTVRLAWTNPPGAGFDHVKIYRSASAGELGQLVATTASETVAAHEDSGLAAGTTYFYTVHSVDALGNESANTNQVSATPPP